MGDALIILGALGYSAGIVLVAVLVIGYPVERYLVRTEDSSLKAATKQFMAVVILAIIYQIAQVVITLISGSGEPNPLIGSSIVWFVIVVISGVTAFIGRVLYPRFLVYKRTMYVVAGLEALLILYLVVSRYIS